MFSLQSLTKDRKKSLKLFGSSLALTKANLAPFESAYFLPSFSGTSSFKYKSFLLPTIP
jgi:hypothetical protein